MSFLPAVRQFPPQEPAPPLPPPNFLQRMVQKYLMPKTSPDRLPSYASSVAMVTQTDGKVGRPNAGVYRAYSTGNPWVRSAINIRRDQVASAEWDIVPFRQGRATGGVRLASRIRDLFENPNPVDGSFGPFVQRVIEDILVLDAGAVELVRRPSDQTIAELWPTPGEYIRVSATWDGSDPDEPRYFWYPDGTERARFKNDDMLYAMQSPRSNTPVGLPPIEVLRLTIDSELQAMAYNRRQVMGAAPDGVLNIGDDAMPEKVQEARSYWQSEILGQNSMAIIGGHKNPAFMRFRDSNRDMQFREWEDLLIRCIATVFGLSPMDLAITFDVNRSTAESQAQNSEDRGIRTLMSLVQDVFTRWVVWDERFGGKDNNFAFRFTALNLKETKQKADINKIAVTTAWKTVNEARIDDGRPPIGEMTDENNLFNHVLVMSAKGLLDLTAERYIGEEQLAQIAADSQVSVEEAKGDIAKEQARVAEERAPDGGDADV